MLMVRSTLKFEKLILVGDWSTSMEAVGIRLNSTLGPVYFVSVYIPPLRRISLEQIQDLFGSIPDNGQVVLLGYFNGHYSYLEPYKANRMASILTQLKERRDLVLINDDIPTCDTRMNTSGSVLDLIFVFHPCLA